jgi:hypothetical protein
LKTFLHILLACLSTGVLAQNEFAKWYFGRYTGLDFMTNPPSVISHTTLNAVEGSASASDAAGNLLFYTDGGTVWNKQQQVMANGTGLLGSGSTVQAALIVKQPGNVNIYYVFTLDSQGGGNGLCYSKVDMSLAAGMGSVTIKNALILSPCTEQLTGVRHCNGIDMWIVTHEFNSNNFRSYLLTASGLNIIPVISAAGLAPPAIAPNNVVIGQGTIKVSPNGRKLGMTYFNGTSNSKVAVFDFDKSTGIVSNYLPLISGTTNCYGCEFSQDGTKFYTGLTSGSSIIQWDLCAGSSQLIAASQNTVGNTPAAAGQLQLAPDGRIYIVCWNTQTLSAINNPNVQGAGCNFIPMAQSVATGTNGTGLPNFIGGAFKILPSFSYALISCANASFAAPPNPTVDLGCGASGYAVQSILWNFGQPLTGTANTSTLSNPSHNFSAPGTYTVKLIFNYQCGADTVYQNITIPGPTITVNSSSVTCTSPGTATVSISGGTGPYTYTWTPSGQTSSTATVNTGAYTLTVNDANGNCTHTLNTIINPMVPLTGTVNTANACNAAANGTAGITMGSGGSGSYTYNWSNAQTTPGISGLAAGIYSVTVTDGNCAFTTTFAITSTSVISLLIGSSTLQACAGTSVNLLAQPMMGTAPFSYSWTGGPTTASYVVTQSAAGTATYSVNVTDQNGCSGTATKQILFLAVPSLTAQNKSICVKESTTLTASGASNYTWSPGNSTSASTAASPSVTQAYTVTCTITNGCSSSTTATVTVFKCTSLSENQAGSGVLKIYPNPTAAELVVETGEEVEILLYDAAGREIIRRKLEAGTHTLDTVTLKAGIYFLKATGRNGSSVTKIIRQE